MSRYRSCSVLDIKAQHALMHGMSRAPSKTKTETKTETKTKQDQKTKTRRPKDIKDEYQDQKTTRSEDQYQDQKTKT